MPCKCRERPSVEILVKTGDIHRSYEYDTDGGDLENTSVDAAAMSEELQIYEVDKADASYDGSEINSHPLQAEAMTVYQIEDPADESVGLFVLRFGECHIIDQIRRIVPVILDAHAVEKLAADSGKEHDGCGICDIDQIDAFSACQQIR